MNSSESNILRYKYLPFNEDSTRVIIDGTMKFTSPRDFNDPFDCEPTYDRNAELNYAANNKHLIAAAGRKLGLSPAERIQQKGAMLKRLEKALDNEDYWHGAAHNIGICCLSRKALNILMWSHYAASHTGFVVEFDIPTVECLLPTEDPYIRSMQVLCPHKVTYDKVRPKINPHDDPLNNVEKQLLIKSDDWQYEAEERVIDTTRGCGIFPYDRRTILKSIIAGINIKKENIDTLRRIADTASNELGREITVHRATKSKLEYKLHVTERADIIE